MIVLDTNVISELMQDETNHLVVKWLDAQPLESVWTTSVCVYEILYGIRLLEEGKRRRYLEKSFENILERLTLACSVPIMCEPASSIFGGNGI